MDSAEPEFYRAPSYPIDGAEPDFIRAMALLCWTVENRQEDDAEIFKREAEALVMKGLDLVR